MSLLPEAIDASYAACRRVSRQARSSFYPTFMLLPRAKRRAMEVLYAFMRHTDDLADEPQPARPRQEALVHWRAAFEHALLGQFDNRNGENLLPAVADTIRRFRIPPEHLRAVIDGVEMDLNRRRFETFEELEQYCDRVASAVGLACIYIWGFHGEQALEPARKCGVAMQLTNILRDLSEDVRQDRVYLPLEDLRQCSYTVDDLLAGVADERFIRLVTMEAARAERLYGEGAELMRWLEADGRRVFGMMTATYRELLRRITRRPADVLKYRIQLGRFRKLRITAQWLLLPPRT